PCKKKFACKKTLTKKDKQKRKKENEHTGKPVCFLCERHWRYLNDKCTNCCERNKCNDIICYHCKKDGVECTRPFPRTQEEYKNFESKVSHINWQFEPTKDGFLHSQVYVQLNTPRWERGKLSEEITGPFEFGKLRKIEKHTKISLRPEEYKNEKYESIVEGNKMLIDGATLLKVFRHNIEKFGPGGSEKTGLVQELFSDKLYYKLKKQRSELNWWNGYEEQKIILINEFYTKINWGDMINILNDSCFNVEKKHGGFEPFIAKYVFLTATKPPEKAYNFNQTGKWHDDISQRTTWIIFHKGDEEKFQNMEWDIKYRSSSNSINQIIEKSNKLNSGIDGEHIIENNYIYWHKAFLEYKKQYLQDYLNSRQLFNYRFESENNQLENELIKIIEDPI
ncbi:10326_t:CDS:2, partial [Gigaspora rosea]